MLDSTVSLVYLSMQYVSYCARPSLPFEMDKNEPFSTNLLIVLLAIESSSKSSKLLPKDILITSTSRTKQSSNAFKIAVSGAPPETYC